MNQSKIYVGSLSYNVTSQELEEFFKQYGEIAESKLITDRETGQSKGFAFVTFANQQAAQASLVADGTDLKGRKIRVNIARDDERGGSGDRRRGPGGRGNFGNRPQGRSSFRGNDGARRGN